MVTKAMKTSPMKAAKAMKAIKTKKKEKNASPMKATKAAKTSPAKAAKKKKTESGQLQTRRSDELDFDLLTYRNSAIIREYINNVKRMRQLLHPRRRWA